MEEDRTLKKIEETRRKARVMHDLKQEMHEKQRTLSLIKS